MNGFVFRPNSFALSVSAAATLLAGCSGLQTLIGAPNAATGFGHSLGHHRTFHYTGKAQSFAVPKGVTQIAVAASGASGQIVAGTSCSRFGDRGGLVHATIRVTPGETLAVFVAGKVHSAGDAAVSSVTATVDSTAAPTAVNPRTPAAVTTMSTSAMAAGVPQTYVEAAADWAIVSSLPAIGGGGGGAGYSQANGGGGDPPRSHGARGAVGIGVAGGSENPRSGGGGAGGGGGGGYYGGGGGGPALTAAARPATVAPEVEVVAEEARRTLSLERLT
jgi:hypothetical protein